MRAAHPLRALTPAEVQALQRITRATSERLDVFKRAQALLAVSTGQGYTQAAQAAGYKSGDSVSQLVERFNQHGLAALQIAAGRGRKVTYTAAQRERIIQELRREPERKTDGPATWSLKTLERSLRKEALPQVGKSTIREVLHEAGYRFGKTRTWCPTGTAIRVRKAGTVTVQDPKTHEKTLIELAYEQAEAAGLGLWCEDEAGPYQAIPQPGEDWHLAGHPKALPHEYVRGGTAKLLTLFRPATGLVRAKGVLSAPNVVLHPWLQAQLQAILAQLAKDPLPVRVPLPDELLLLTWQHWWWSYETSVLDRKVPPTRRKQ
jgi:transposase